MSRRFLMGFFGALFGVAVLTPAVFGQAIDSGLRPGPFPSLYPAIAYTPTPSPFPSGGVYPQAGGTSVPMNLPTFNPSANIMYLGTVDGETCTAQAIVADNSAASPVPTTQATTAATTAPTAGPTTYPTTYPTTTATMWPAPTASIAPDGSEELCYFGNSGSTPNFLWYPLGNAFNAQPLAFSKISINGVVSQYLGNGTEAGEWRIPRVIGQQYVATTYNGGTNGGNVFSFSVTAKSLATAEAAAATPLHAVTNWLGAFARPWGSPPYGMNVYGNTGTAPSPYPSPKPSDLFGAGSYCDAAATGNGFSLTTGYPFDYNKLNDLVREGIQFTRTLADPYYIEQNVTDGAGGTFSWFAWDAMNCQLIRNNILPTVDVNAGPVIYSGASPNPLPVFKNPTDFGTYCSALATHEHAAFPTVTRWEIPNNETNTNNPINLADMEYADAPYNTEPGEQVIAQYSLACYQAIKAVNPNYIVYWGEVAMGSTNAIPFIQSMYTYGLRIGHGFDGIDVHLGIVNDPLAQYDPADSQNGYQGDGQTAKIIDAIAYAVQKMGETRPVHILDGEDGLYPTCPTTNSQYGNLGDQVVVWPRHLLALQQYPYVDGVVIANSDEDIRYEGTPFACNGQWDTTTNPSASPSPRPVIAYVQPFAGVNPSSPPTVAPGSTPTPGPTATPTSLTQAVINACSGIACDYYRGNETSGTVAVDSLGSYNGTYIGGVTLNQTALTVNDAGSPLYDGSTGYMQTTIPTSAAALNGQSLSLGFWFRYSALPGANQVFVANASTESANPASGLAIRYMPGTGVRIALATSEYSAGGTTLVCPTTPVVNTTYFVVMTYDGANLKCYMNNASPTSAAVTGNIAPASSPVTFIKDLTYGTFNGASLSEPFVMDTVLTPTQISQMYALGI